ncbi:ATP-binding protein [Thermithiobacillus tepidarius DSM 3134]|uniref:sensor histidine kinase n=1 Tax=Thermithiobacillus tepidarius TaxID=929 RepID=UPI001B7F8BB8|nr:ATP-binding protein [Thermithiobacillus tepidarius]
MTQFFKAETEYKTPLALSFRLLVGLLAVFACLYGVYAWHAVKTEKLRELASLADFAAKSAEQFYGLYASSLDLLGQDLLEIDAVRNRAAGQVLLHRFKRSHPEIGAVNLHRPNGDLLIPSELPLDRPLPDLRGLPTFMPDMQRTAAGTGLYVARPRYGIIVRQWIMPLQYPVRDGQGRLRFILSANLWMENQQALWRDVALPAGTTIGLIREDGFLESRWPNPLNFSAIYGQPRTGPLVQTLRRKPVSETGTFQGVTDVDREFRFGAYHRLPNYPLTAFVSLPRTVIWQAWLKRIQIPLALLLFLLIGTYSIWRFAFRVQRQLERERRRARAQLEQRVAERTAALMAANRELEAFSYSVSHDLRAPLRAIDGFSLVLLEDYGEALDPAGREYLARVRRASQRMAELIDAMLNLARLSRGELQREPLDLSAFAREIAERLRQTQATRQVEFVLAEGVLAEGDAQLIRAVLENLLTNAWKFTSKQADARIEFGVREEAEERIYFVRDNGVGFDMAYADKLFGAFQRLHSPGEFEGHGIGLATVARIIARHGGRIWAEGVVGQGAAFYFTLAAREGRSERLG